MLPLAQETASSRLDLHGAKVSFTFGVGAFLIASAVLMVLADTHPKQVAEHGMVIPDVANMSAWLHDFALDDPPWSRASNLPGPWLLFSSLGAPSAAVCLTINALLVAGAAVLWWGMARAALTHPAWSVLALIANPYLLLAMHGPNKDVPVLFLSLLFARVVFCRRRFWVINSLFACGLIYLFRDGYAVILAMLVLTLRWFGQRTLMVVALLALAGVIASALSGHLGQHLPFVGRQFARAADPSIIPAMFRWALGALAVEPTSALVEPFLLVGRVVYNSTSQALFPVVFTNDGGIHLLGVAYYVNGVFMLAAIPLSVLVVIRGRRQPTWGAFAGGVILSVVILSSVSPQIQPRYFMPLWPMAYLVMGACTRKATVLAIAGAAFLSISTVLVYHLMGHPPASAVPFDPEFDLELTRVLTET